jgi:hypothetical protein
MNDFTCRTVSEVNLRVMCQQEGAVRDGLGNPHLCDRTARHETASLQLEYDRYNKNPSIFVPGLLFHILLPRTQQFLPGIHQLLFHPLRLSHADIIAQFRAQSGFHDQGGALR